MSHQPTSIITYVTRRRTGHAFHWFMTIITGGAWAVLIWLPLALYRSTQTSRRTVTTYRYGR